LQLFVTGLKTGMLKNSIQTKKTYICSYLVHYFSRSETRPWKQGKINWRLLDTRYLRQCLSYLVNFQQN
jgi:hypothetical protein